MDNETLFSKLADLFGKVKDKILTPQLRKYNRTIPAGGELSVNTDSQFFYILESAYEFEVSVNGGEFIPMSVGLGYNAPLGTFIENITLRNTLDVDCAVRIVHGRGSMSDMRLNVIESRNGSAASLVPNGNSNGTFNAIDGVTTLIKPANPNAKDVYLSFEFAGGMLAAMNEITICDSLGFVMKRIVFVDMLANIPPPTSDDSMVYIDITILAVLVSFTVSIKNYNGALYSNHYIGSNIPGNYTETTYN